VSTIELGVPSLDDGVLAESGRGHTAADAIGAARLVRAGGFALGLQMMTGLPGDGPDKSRLTALGLADLRPDFVRIYPALVVEGSGLADLWRAGAYRPPGLEETVVLLTELAGIFGERGIPVARIGLHLDGETSRAILAGPVHPSIGDLVRRKRRESRAHGD
jgi:histone acetyltransferase (RNA polymerase elongator complex component)